MQKLLKYLLEKDSGHASHVPTIAVPLHPSYYEFGAGSCVLFASLGIWLITVTPLINIQMIGLVVYLALVNALLGALAGIYLAARWCIWRYPTWVKAAARPTQPTNTIEAESHLYEWSLQRSETLSMISPY